MIRACLIASLLAWTVLGHSERVRAADLPDSILTSVVSVLPVWPGKPQGGAGTPAGAAPEGSGIAIRPGGLIATAYHVIEPAERVDVRLYDGRILPAKVVGQDRLSDIALLKVDENLTVFDHAPKPALASRACVISNAYGLDLSVTCGVVSARNVSNAGFNAVEDFIQTDAAANPGSSGGALVDEGGRLIGMVSAIFASRGETNIGVNFAVSTSLLDRVVDDLHAKGHVSYVSAGWGLEMPTRQDLAIRAGARVASLAKGGTAQKSGVQTGDLIVSLAGRDIRKPRDVVSALALVRQGEAAELLVHRDGVMKSLTLTFAQEKAQAGTAAAKALTEFDEASSAIGTPDCPYAAAVCLTRQAVFPVESYDPLASAVRIGPDLLVTNRHVVADRTQAVVFTPGGPLKGKVIPSSYRGDLALIQVAGLPDTGLILTPDIESPFDLAASEPLHAVGADLDQRQIRVFPPGHLTLPPAADADLGRLHVTSYMQPGVSGGALIDGAGDLVGIAVGGGEGRYEALPARDIADLLNGRSDLDAEAVQGGLGRSLVLCQDAMDSVEGQQVGEEAIQLLQRVFKTCSLAKNQGHYLNAGRILGTTGRIADAITLHELAVDQVPNSVNARLSLLTSLQIAGRYEDMVPHVRFLLDAQTSDLQGLRLAIQSGTLGGEAELAERAYKLMEKAYPREAEAARRFIDNSPLRPKQ
ncbi:serine protease [Roseibium algae]|uniref:Trypsin-like peptidase domain-containing protein n=1 Tax=Roseibium algae TaxID=3123038 RepID=A0ABU8TIT2_9HYPH